MPFAHSQHEQLRARLLQKQLTAAWTSARAHALPCWKGHYTSMAGLAATRSRAGSELMASRAKGNLAFCLSTH